MKSNQVYEQEASDLRAEITQLRGEVQDHENSLTYYISRYEDLENKYWDLLNAHFNLYDYMCKLQKEQQQAGLRIITALK